MKKILSMILVTAVLLSCVMITAFAKEKPSKITATLAEKLENLSDGERIEAHIWLYCTIDKSEVFHQAITECGYIGGLPLNMTSEEVYAYRAVYNRIVSEKEAAVANAFVKKLGIGEDDIVYLGKHPYVIAKLTKAQIETAATYSETESVGYADSNESLIEKPVEPPQPGQLYLSRFEEKYTDRYTDLVNYRELYYHHDKNGEIDWVLVRAVTNMRYPMILNTIIGNRVISDSSCDAPFDAGYGIYDVRNDTFVDATWSAAKDYDGFTRAFDQNVTEGGLLGDLDKDNEISIIDATLLRRCEARILEYSADDEIAYLDERNADLPKYYSDFDRDGERTILDATKIQRYLVNG